MTEIGSSPKVVRFGEFDLDLREGSLSRRGVRLRLREQLFVVLSLLVENAGEIVTREQLQKRLWPDDIFIDFEISLNTIIAKLREALGDSAEHPRYIETLPKRGYRFLATPSESDSSGLAPPRRLRLVVRPFTNMGGDPADEYLSDAMTDDLITALSKVAPDHLAVIARPTAMHYKGSPKDVSRIGRELGVDYVVEGVISRSENRVTTNAQLIQTSDQTLVFAGNYDTEMSELFNFQTRIAEDLAKHIPSLPGFPTEVPTRKKPTDDLEAYQLFLQGRHHMYKMTPDRQAKAKKCFEEAIARDPKFALAYDGLGESFWWTSFWGHVPPRQACFVGMGLVLRALEIDPTLGETHALLGQFRQKVDYNWPEVRREMMLAMELDPSSPLVRVRYAVSDLLPHADLQEAIAQVERAMELDPLSWGANFWLSCFYWLARDYERGMKAAKSFQQNHPQNYMAPFMIASICRDSGKTRDAIAPQSEAVEMSGGQPQMLGWLSLNLALDRKTAEARSVLRRLQDISSKTYVSPTSFIWAHLGLEEIDDAFVWMGRAIEERDSIIIPIKTYPSFDPLRDDPRYSALLRKMNLEP
jgi:TolB-like protein